MSLWWGQKTLSLRIIILHHSVNPRDAKQLPSGRNFLSVPLSIIASLATFVFVKIVLVTLIKPRHEKTGFRISENKDADQLRGNHESDQRLCFRYIDSSTAEDIYTAAGWESILQNRYLHGSRSRGSAKSAIYTVAGCQHKIAIHTAAAIPEPIQIYTRLPCVNIKSLFTRQPQIGYIHCCRVYKKIVIYTAAVQEPNWLYTLLPGVYIKLLFTQQALKSKFKINSGLLGVHMQCLFTRQ